MGNTDRNSEIEEMNIESETELKDNSLEACEDYLKKEISGEMSLESIVDVFEKMCEIPADDDMIRNWNISIYGKITVLLQYGKTDSGWRGRIYSASCRCFIQTNREKQ